MSRPQGPKPPHAPPLQPQQQHWSQQGELDHSARAMAAAAQGWQAPAQTQQPGMPPQFNPQYAAPAHQPQPYGYPPQAQPPAPAQYAPQPAQHHPSQHHPLQHPHTQAPPPQAPRTQPPMQHPQAGQYPSAPHPGSPPSVTQRPAAQPAPALHVPHTAPPQHDPHGLPRTAPPQQQSHQHAYQPPQMREPGLDAFGVQIGQPRTAPPQHTQPRFADQHTQPRYPEQQTQPRFAEQPGRGPAPQMPPQPAPQMPGMRADPGSYDLGGYGVPPSAPPSRIPQAPQDQWQRDPAPSFPPPGLQPQPSFPGAAQGMGRPDQFGQPQPAGDLHSGLPAEQHQDQDDLEYEEEPRRSRRWMIAAALVLSIGVGGGMAYAYKTVFGPTKGTQTAVVKAPRDAAKSTPENPGGKRFPNADNKFMNRLDGDVAAEVEQGGVKRVQTVTVGPDRGVVGAAPPASGPRPVPGMTIVGAEALTQQAAGPPPGFGAAPGLPPARAPSAPPPVAGGPAAARPAAAPPAAVAPAPPPQQPRPQVLAKAATPAPAAPSAFDGEPAAPAKQPVARAAPPAPKRTGGYVAVLGYQRSQLEAMKLMADLQQKYGVLRDKKLEVIESDQSSRGLGTIYRVVVGPSGGLADAKSICTQVVQAGHPAKDCYTLSN